jgi:hypothetical protein
VKTNLEIPKIKKISEECLFIRGCQQRTITKVRFKDGTALTFAGPISRREAAFNAYY